MCVRSSLFLLFFCQSDVCLSTWSGCSRFSRFLWIGYINSLRQISISVRMHLQGIDSYFVVINGVICLWINMYKCVKSAVSVWNKRSLITNMICVSCIWYSQIKTHLYSAILSIKWYIYHFMVVDKGPKIFTSIQFCFALTPTKWAKDKQKRGIKSSDINKNSTIRRMLFQIAYLNDCL